MSSPPSGQGCGCCHQDAATLRSAGSTDGDGLAERGLPPQAMGNTPKANHATPPLYRPTGDDLTLRSLRRKFRQVGPTLLTFANGQHRRRAHTLIWPLPCELSPTGFFPPLQPTLAARLAFFLGAIVQVAETLTGHMAKLVRC